MWQIIAAVTLQLLYFKVGTMSITAYVKLILVDIRDVAQKSNRLEPSGL